MQSTIKIYELFISEIFHLAFQTTVDSQCQEALEKQGTALCKFQMYQICASPALDLSSLLSPCSLSSFCLLLGTEAICSAHVPYLAHLAIYPRVT